MRTSRGYYNWGLIDWKDCSHFSLKMRLEGAAAFILLQSSCLGPAPDNRSILYSIAHMNGMEGQGG